MAVITIPKKLATRGDLVVIPRKEYEDLLRVRVKNFKEFSPSPAQKKALMRAERNLRDGKTISYHELSKRLGFAD